MYPGIQLNQYGNATIVGDLHDLTEGVQYLVKAVEKTGKYGIQYDVINARRQKPDGKTETTQFLREILTEGQAEVLIEAYPDIVDRIIKNEYVDLSLTKGIKNKTFAVIKKKVIENFALVELIETYSAYGITIAMLKKMYDKYASIEKLEYTLKTDPYGSLCSISGIGFKRADSIILNIPKNELGTEEDLKTSKQRMKACMNFILQENESDGNTKMKIQTFRNKCKELTPQCINHFVDIVKNDESIYYNREKKAVSTNLAYKTELYISDFIKSMLKRPRAYNFEYEMYRENDGNELTDMQFKALTNLCENNISLLAGEAGTGKTFTTQSVIHMLDDNRLTYLLVSPTGKSSKILANLSGRDASTIHRGLKFNPKEGWGFNEKNKLDVDVVICDEAGMVDIYLMKHLLEAVDDYKTKILFIQDPAQIPSVASGNCSEDMLKSEVIPTSYLDKVFRYGEGGLYNVATNIRSGKYYIPATKKTVINFGTNEDYSLINIPQEHSVDAIVNLYEKLLKSGVSIDDIMVLSHHNKGDYGSKVINKAIQSKINPPKGNNFVKHGDTNFVLGDKVIQVVNNYKIKDVDDKDCEVFNGGTGTIVKIDKYSDEIVIEFDGVMLVYGKDELSQLLLGYAMSIHKCLTGDTWIYTDNGIKRIDEMCVGVKKGQFAPINEKVFNGTYLEGKVQAYNNGVDKCRLFTTQRGQEITTTYKHGLDVLSEGGVIVRKEAKDINVGDYIVNSLGANIFGDNTEMPKHWCNNNMYRKDAKIFNLPNKIDEDFAKFIGCMIADGTVSKSTGSIKFSKRHREVVEDFKEIVERLFGYTNGKIVYRKSGDYMYECNSVFIRDFCLTIEGIQPNNKFIPREMMSTPINIMANLLSTIFEDGTVNLNKGKFGHIEIAIKNQYLSSQINTILLNMGIMTTIWERRGLAYIYIYRYDAVLFEEKIGFISDFKKDRLSLAKSDSGACSNRTTLIPYVTNIIKGLIDSELSVKVANKLKRSIRKNQITYAGLSDFLEDNKQLNKNKEYETLQFMLEHCYFSKVTDIQDNIGKQTYCLEMPETHKFVQNGFYGWNSQASGSKYVIVNTPKAHTYFINRNLLYTAITRTSLKCFHISSNELIKSALKKSATHERQTFLLDMLKENL